MTNANKRILKHLIAFVLILTVILVGLMISLRKYTQQDSVIAVPDVRTLTLEDAIPFITGKGLRYMVVDSVHVETLAPGTILEQKPAPGSKVKQNRFLFLTINSAIEEQIIFPDVKDFSQRQAVATLEAAGLKVSSIEYMPSEYRDLVLGVRYQNKTLSAGVRLPKRSSVVLIVGQEGDASTEITVPSLHGMYLRDAIEVAHSNNLNIGDIHNDIPPANADAAKRFKVYKQSPITGSPSSTGKTIEVWMTEDEELLSNPDEVYSDADYIEN